MSALDDLRPALLAITRVRMPSLPVAVLHDESAAVLTWLAQGAMDALIAVGLPLDALTDAQHALSASREAQAAWRALRRGASRAAHPVGDARALRADLAAAIRWNLRADRSALATLRALIRGESQAEMVASLDGLARLLEQHAARFDADATTDPMARAAEARAAAAALAQHVSAVSADDRKRAARDLRDRAVCHLDRQMARLRAAGEFAFRERPEDLQRLRSPYRRRLRLRHAAKKKARGESGSGGG